MITKKKVTLNDLVKASGYSKSTVSKVMNNKGRISTKTREIINDKAKEIGFVSDYYAQTLKNGNTKLIGVIFPENTGIGLSHSFFSTVLDTFKKRIEESGYEMLFINLNQANREMSYIEYCDYRKVEGILVVTFKHDDQDLIDLIESDIPLVATDYHNELALTVVSDDYKGGRLATEYLLSMGHENIVHIAGPLTTSAGLKRFLGYAHVMEENGYMDYRLEVADDFTVESSYERTLNIINKKNFPSAVFCASDWMALGAIKAFKENGYRIPEDVSIIGYDDTEALKYYEPRLTTVSQNPYEIGRQAAIKLLNVINKKEETSVLTDVSLVKGNSCIKIHK